MSNFGLVQAQHLGRKAVIYIRQSSGHQVLNNTESGRMQRAMKEHAQRLGWHEPQVQIVEADTGVSAATTAGRDAYKQLLSEVALGNVGVVLSYESARLSRNCSDWYPLLDVCALSGCLIADREALVHGPKLTVKVEPQCWTITGVTVDEVPEAQPVQVHEEGLSRS